MKYKRFLWKRGAVYGIPLADGSFGVCQAVDTMMTNVVYIAVFSYHFDELPIVVPNLAKENILSLGATWRQQLNNGSWPGIGVAEPVVEKCAFPNEATADNGYIDAKHSDVGLYAKFLSACFGLTPWNTMFDQDCWEEYLNTMNARPDRIKILDPSARTKYRTEILGIEAKQR